MACTKNQLLQTLEGGTAPTKGSKYSAAIDLYASETVEFIPNSTHIVGLGVAICSTQLEKLSPDVRNRFMSTHYLALHPRSSLRAKGFVANTGIIDMDYIATEIKIILKYEPNESAAGWEQKYIINAGDRIAQIMLLSHDSTLLNIKSDEERIGGIGSTGE